MASRLLRRITLTCALAGASSRLLCAETPWVEVRSPHFLVMSDASTGLAEEVATAFENMREVFKMGFPNLKVAPQNPPIIFAVRDEESMKVLQPWIWDDPKNVHPDGIYYRDGAQDYVVVRADLWSRTDLEHHIVYHEYTHSVMSLNFRQLPVWLNEGLAEYYGDSVFERNEVSIGKTNQWRLRYLDQSTWMPMATLLKVDHHSPYYTEWARTNIFYAQSWILVRYLLNDPEAVQQQVLQKFLKVWTETGDGDRAAQESLGDLEALQGRLKVYMNRKVHGYQRMPFKPLDPGKDLAIRTLPLAEGLVAQGLFLERIGHLKEATTFIQKAAQLDPKLGSAHTGLGVLAAKNNDAEGAQKEFLEGMKLAPDDFRPPLELGLNALRHPGQAQPEQIVAWLETATRLNPKSAPAFNALARAYLDLPEKKALATGAEKRAFELNNMDLGYLAMFGRCWLALDKIPEAKAVGGMLKKLAFTAHDKELRDAYLADLTKAEQRLKGD